jgi:hypothetical protein
MAAEVVAVDTVEVVLEVAEDTLVVVVVSVVVVDVAGVVEEEDEAGVGVEEAGEVDAAGATALVTLG